MRHLLEIVSLLIAHSINSTCMRSVLAPIALNSPEECKHSVTSSRLSGAESRLVGSAMAAGPFKAAFNGAFKGPCLENGEISWGRL
jgi:hypothetical protein